MDILLIHEDESTRDTLAFALESGAQAVVHSAESPERAIDLLLQDLPINLIVCLEDARSMTLFKYLLSLESQIPCILIRLESGQKMDAFPDLNVIGDVQESELPDGLVDVIHEAVKEGMIESREESEEYCRIKTALLLRVVPLKADVFIRLSSIKYVRIFKKGDVFDEKDLEKYLVSKQIPFLYLKTKDSGVFIKQLGTTLTKILKKDVLPVDESVRIAAQIHGMVMELSGRFGFTPEVQELVQQNVDTVMSGIRKVRGLDQIAAILDRGKGEYISNHSVMLANIAGLFATRTEWSSPATFEKLTFAALLHDITLGNQKLAAIQSLKELDTFRGAFTPTELGTFRSHPIEASEIAMKFEKIPPDVWTIIREHHERPDGSGFPRALGASRISPISALFIIAHDVVSAYFKGEKDLDGFLKKNKETYHVGNFRKVMDFILAGD